MKSGFKPSILDNIDCSKTVTLSPKQTLLLDRLLAALDFLYSTAVEDLSVTEQLGTRNIAQWAELRSAAENAKQTGHVSHQRWTEAMHVPYPLRCAIVNMARNNVSVWNCAQCHGEREVRDRPSSDSWLVDFIPLGFAIKRGKSHRTLNADGEFVDDDSNLYDSLLMSKSFKATERADLHHNTYVQRISRRDVVVFCVNPPHEKHHYLPPTLAHAWRVALPTNERHGPLGTEAVCESVSMHSAIPNPREFCYSNFNSLVPKHAPQKAKIEDRLADSIPAAHDGNSVSFVPNTEDGLRLAALIECLDFVHREAIDLLSNQKTNMGRTQSMKMLRKDLVDDVVLLRFSRHPRISADKRQRYLKVTEVPHSLRVGVARMALNHYTMWHALCNERRSRPFVRPDEWHLRDFVPIKHCLLDKDGPYARILSREVLPVPEGEDGLSILCYLPDGPSGGDNTPSSKCFKVFTLHDPKQPRHMIAPSLARMWHIQ